MSGEINEGEALTTKSIASELCMGLQFRKLLGGAHYCISSQSQEVERLAYPVEKIWDKRVNTIAVDATPAGWQLAR